jgi:hypothetical protein
VFLYDIVYSRTWRAWSEKHLPTKSDVSKEYIYNKKQQLDSPWLFY